MNRKIFTVDPSFYCKMKISLSWSKEQSYNACPESHETPCILETYTNYEEIVSQNKKKRYYIHDLLLIAQNSDWMTSISVQTVLYTVALVHFFLIKS